MLRFWITVSLLVTVVFTGIGLLIWHAWGWSEYASDELYVIYEQWVDIHPNPLFIINANGDEEGEKLSWKQGTITALDCSPDGRTLAFLIDMKHLYVVTSTGISYDKAVNIINGAVGNFNVTNNETVAFKTLNDNFQVVSSTETRILERPQYEENPVGPHISSQGLALWSTAFAGIHLTSMADEKIIQFVPHAIGEEWLPDEQLFSYISLPSGIDKSSQASRFLVDAATGKTIYLNDWTIPALFSPDGTKIVLGVLVQDIKEKQQLVIFDPLTDAPGRNLTHDPNIAVQPMCFLTFRPQMLISGS